MTVRPPVCAGEPHRWEVTRSGTGQNGLITVAEFVGDAAYSYKRVTSPTPTEWQEMLTHAFEAGQDYEIRRQMELDAEVEADQDPSVVPDNLCPGCHKPEADQCECTEDVRKYRAELRSRFAPGGDGADLPRRKANSTVTYYPAHGRATTAPATTTPATTVPATEPAAKSDPADSPAEDGPATRSDNASQNGQGSLTDGDTAAWAGCM